MIDSPYVVSQSYGVSIDDVFAVEVSAGPSLDEIKKLPNKVLLWCGKYQITGFMIKVYDDD